VSTKARRSLDLNGFFEQLENESDRAAAVLGVASLDYFLEQMLRKRLHEQTKSTMYDFNGPLGDLSGKIEIAFAIGLIDAEARDALHILRAIRNDFAHDPDHRLSFHSPSVSDRLRSLPTARLMDQTMEKLLEAARGGLLQAQAEAVRSSNAEPRVRFQLAVAVLAGVVAEAAGGPRFTSASASSLSRNLGELL
jgi:DNA-binding MltR family transcriptional regulator